MDDLDIDVGDKAQVKAEQKKFKTKKLIELEAWKDVLKTKQGRDVLWRILRQCAIYDSPVTHPQETFRQLGHRDIGRWILEEISQCDEKAYITMQIESLNREN